MADEKKNKGGRPPKYKHVEDMQALIDKYFNDCDETETPYTITGLAMALDMTREKVIKYGQKDEFRDAIKKAKQKVENSYELRLIKSGRAGDIFALKNFGWSDRQETSITGSVDIKIGGSVKDWAK